MATYESIGIVDMIGQTFWDTSVVNGFDPVYSPDGMVVISMPGSNKAIMRLGAVTNEAWFHSNIYKYSQGGIYGANSAPIEVYNTTNDKLLEIRSNGNSAWHRIYYRVGGVLTNSGVDIIWGGNARFVIMDIHITTNATSGSYEIYQDNVIVWSVTNIDTGNLPIDRIEYGTSSLGGTNAAARYGYSEFFCGIGNSPTVGKRAFNTFMTGNSTVDTAWTGDYTAIDDPLSSGDGSFVYTSGIGNRIGFTTPALPTASASIEAIGITSISMIGSASPRNYQHYIKLSGTNYDQALVSPSGVLASHSSIMTSNPATSNPWTISDLNTVEYGFISS